MPQYCDFQQKFRESGAELTRIIQSREKLLEQALLLKFTTICVFILIQLAYGPLTN